MEKDSKLSTPKLADVISAEVIALANLKEGDYRDVYMYLKNSTRNHKYKFVLHDKGLEAFVLDILNEKFFKDKPRWMQKEARHRLGPGERMKIADQQRRRDETLVGVDRAVNSIVQALGQQGLLDDTYVIFTSDNGLFRGEHRIAGGKYLPHEPSSHVPLMIRGPGITPGSNVNELVSNVDLGVTLFEIAGIGSPGLDGRSLLPFLDNPSLRTTRPLLLEADTGPGRGIGAGHDPDLIKKSVAKAGLARLRGVKNLDQEKLAGKAQATGDRAPAYRAIRTDRYLYVLYSSGDVELYDMQADPAQLRSLARVKRYAPVRKWLFGKLVALLNCDGQACRNQIGEPPALSSRGKASSRNKKAKKKRRR